MKVLSLLQPWASLVVTQHPFKIYGGHYCGIKQWETRSWEPKDPALLSLLRTEGFLIHASAAWRPDQRELMNQFPFADYKPFMPQTLPLGCIIGHVKLGEIWTSEKWIGNYSRFDTEGPQEEYCFGDYSKNRFAWELLKPTSFPVPIPAKGRLGFWDYQLTAMAV